MSEATLRDLQLAQLQELKDIAAFCDANGIAYFLDSGTLLGAVRHKGFIPWDDDVDICMDVKSYRRFLKLARKLPERYYFQNYRTDPTMTRKWTKIRIHGTTVTPKHLPVEDTHAGACLDIFIMAGAAKTKPGKWLQRKADTVLRAYLNGTDKSTLRRFLARCAEWVLLLDTRHSDQAFSSYYTPEAEDAVYMPSALFDPAERVKLPFEDADFYAPKNYEAVLEAYYGDWRTPPSEEERTGHGELLIDLKNDYHKYLA